jgi:hypothetical protein
MYLATRSDRCVHSVAVKRGNKVNINCFCIVLYVRLIVVLSGVAAKVQKDAHGTETG